MKNVGTTREPCSAKRADRSTILSLSIGFIRQAVSPRRLSSPVRALETPQYPNYYALIPLILQRDHVHLVKDAREEERAVNRAKCAANNAKWKDEAHEKREDVP